MSQAADDLRTGIERLERLDAEIAEIREHRKGVLQEYKSKGYEPKVMNHIVRERKMNPDALETWLSDLEIARAAVGITKGNGAAGDGGSDED